MLRRTSTIQWHVPQPWRGGLYERAFVTDAVARNGAGPGVLYRYRRGTEMFRAGPSWLARYACLSLELIACRYIRWCNRQLYDRLEHRRKAGRMLWLEFHGRTLKNALRECRAALRNRWGRARSAPLLPLPAEPESIEEAARAPPEGPDGWNPIPGRRLRPGSSGGLVRLSMKQSGRRGPVAEGDRHNNSEFAKCAVRAQPSVSSTTRRSSLP